MQVKTSDREQKLILQWSFGSREISLQSSKTRMTFTRGDHSLRLGTGNEALKREQEKKTKHRYWQKNEKQNNRVND